mgnify:CR=1 FL=1
MFDKDFFPTPNELIDKMAKKVDWSIIGHTNLRVLEPSAGKGNIVDWLNNQSKNRKLTIEVLEKHLELCSILMDKECKVVGEDFLTFQTFTEYDIMIANPPFSEGVKHLLKMIELAKQQSYKECQIVCLLNAETIKNPFSNERKHLGILLEKYQAEIEFLEGAFEGAERSTKTEVALVYLKISKETNKVSYFESLFDNLEQVDPQDYALALSLNELGHRMEEISLLVNLYQEHIRRLKSIWGELEGLRVYENFLNDRFRQRSRYSLLDRNADFYEHLEKIRVEYWQEILKTERFSALLTSETRGEFQQNIERLKNTEITFENIYTMLLSLSQNQEKYLTSALENFFDEVTSHSVNEFNQNIHYYNGWRTNSAYKLNPKIILPLRRGFVMNPAWVRTGYNSVDYKIKDKLEDILKVFDLVSATSRGEWVQLGDYEFENNLIRFKYFKKETIHIWFKDLQALAKLNYIVGQSKNWLPTEEEVKTSKEAKEFIKKELPELNSYVIGFKAS